MIFPKFVPLAMVGSLLMSAAGAGAAWAIAGAKQSHADERAESHERRLEVLEQESQRSRERILRIEVLAEETNKTVERIERKLDRR